MLFPTFILDFYYLWGKKEKLYWEWIEWNMLQLKYVAIYKQMQLV